MGAYIRTAWVPTFTYTYEYTYTLTLLTDPSFNIARPSVTVSFGDNSSGTLLLVTITNLNGTTVKTYTGSHLYAGSTPDGAYYAVEYQDTFRVAGIKNFLVSQTQSVYARAIIVANQLFWTKPSGMVTNFPPTLGVSENTVIYDPMFVRGTTTDSVSFTLFDHFNAGGFYIPNGAVLSPTSGILTFSKDSIGLYAFNIKMTEWGKDNTGIRRPNRTTYVDFAIDISSTVGINEYSGNSSQIKFYPNPTSNYLSIENFGLENDNLDYSIYNVSGQKMIEGTLSTIHQKSIDVSNLHQGIYLIMIKEGNRAIRNKFIKTND